MSLAEYFPVFDKLKEEDRAELLRTSVMRTAPKGTLLNGGGTCMGLLVVRSGQLRAFITSEEGREVTLYRLFDHDICLFSASCVMNSVRFSISIAVEKDAQFWVIPPNVYREMMEHSAVLANYTNELMASRFSASVLPWKICPPANILKAITGLGTEAIRSSIMGRSSG